MSVEGRALTTSHSPSPLDLIHILDSTDKQEASGPHLYTEGDAVHAYFRPLSFESCCHKSWQVFFYVLMNLLSGIIILIRYYNHEIYFTEKEVTVSCMCVLFLICYSCVLHVLGIALWSFFLFKLNYSQVSVYLREVIGIIPYFPSLQNTAKPYDPLPLQKRDMRIPDPGLRRCIFPYETVDFSTTILF